MKFIWIIILLAAFILGSCKKIALPKYLKNPDPAYKLRMAEQYFVKKNMSLLNSYMRM